MTPLNYENFVEFLH